MFLLVTWQRKENLKMLVESIDESTKNENDKTVELIFTYPLSGVQPVNGPPQLFWNLIHFVDWRKMDYLAQGYSLLFSRAY